jgi:hypothetical protein
LPCRERPLLFLRVCKQARLLTMDVSSSNQQRPNKASQLVLAT